MELKTTRFGVLRVAESDILDFPEGLPGLEECREWVLLPDLRNDAVAWLQSTSSPEIALAVVSPRRFVADYTVRVSPAELQPLGMSSKHDAQVLAIVSVHAGEPTLNLKAPLVINRRNRIGRQVVTNGDMPLQCSLRLASTQQRQAA
ncbi:MAG: flagellar assembly protein FliW [Pirellulales bacterium]